MSQIKLREPCVGGPSPQNSKACCTVEFFSWTFNPHAPHDAWTLSAIAGSDLFGFLGHILLMKPKATHGFDQKWRDAFPGTPPQPPLTRAFEVKIEGRLELVHLTWHKLSDLLPFTPRAYPLGAYAVILESRAYWEARQTMLSMQEFGLDLLSADDGPAADENATPKVPLNVTNAVADLKAEIQAVTVNTRTYTELEQRATTASLGTRWAALASALAAHVSPDLQQLGHEMAAVPFPTVATQAPEQVGFASLAAVRAMDTVFEKLARIYARHRIQRTVRLSSWAADRSAAMEHFFSSLESVYEASRIMGGMTTSSTGNASFQRGVHGAVLEETFRTWLRDRVSPLIVSTGTMMGAPQKDQLDVLIWDATFAEAVLRIGDVAYVPAPAVRGILEIKGGVGDTVGTIAKRLFSIQVTHSALCQLQGYNSDVVPVLGVVVADSGQFETLSAKGANLVLPLFQSKTDARPKRNIEAFDALMDFLGLVAAHKVKKA